MAHHPPQLSRARSNCCYCRQSRPVSQRKLDEQSIDRSEKWAGISDEFADLGAVRPLDREPLLPIFLRRIELLPSAAVRSIVDDTLAPAAWRGTARRADPGKSVGGAQDWRHRP